jgi:flagellin FlaB
MSNIPGKVLKAASLFRQDQRGITGLETAIVLIAFVVVSSVFAFAALSTGLFSSDKAKETISAGLAEARGTLELKGSVIAMVSGTTGASGVVTTMEFQVSNAAAGESIDLTPGNTVIKYSDSSQTVNMNASSEFTSTNVAAFGDSDNLLEVGEVFEIVLLDMTTQLTTDLGTNKEFTLEVVPPSGAVLYIGRRTPVSLESSNNLN